MRYKNTIASILVTIAIALSILGIIEAGRLSYRTQVETEVIDISEEKNKNNDQIEINDRDDEEILEDETIGSEKFITKEVNSFDLYLAFKILFKYLYKVAILYGLAELIEILYIKKNEVTEKPYLTDREESSIDNKNLDNK